MDHLSQSFHDAIYFSVTTFTTLGYGDMQPLPEMRLATSIESLAGMFSVALASAVVFLWCQDHTVPYDLAFFDANRRHKKGIGMSRIRIRTISGKGRKLSEWVPPPQEGEVLYHDERRGEWLTVSSASELPDNALVITGTDQNAAIHLYTHERACPEARSARGRGVSNDARARQRPWISAVSARADSRAA